MIRTVMALAATAALLAACGDSSKNAEGGDNTAGPVVSAAETPRNEAVDTTPTADAAAQTPGANSFTEAQARAAIEGAGYGEVGPLTQDAQGIWMGEATKGGAKTRVSVDYKGAVAAVQ